MDSAEENSPETSYVAANRTATDRAEADGFATSSSATDRFTTDRAATGGYPPRTRQLLSSLATVLGVLGLLALVEQSAPYAAAWWQSGQWHLIGTRLLFGGALVTLLLQNAFMAHRESSLAARLARAEAQVVAQKAMLAARESEHQAHQSRFEQTLQQGIRANERLQQSAHRFQSLFANLPVACFTHDTMGRIDEWNLASERLYGLNRDQVVQRTIWETIYAERSQAQARVLVKRIQAGETIRGMEQEHRCVDGTMRSVLYHAFPLTDHNGSVVGGLSAVVDITDRKQAEAETRLLSLVAAKSLNGILLTNAEGITVYVNPAMERITGYSTAEWEGQRPGDLVQGPLTDPGVKQQLRQAISQRQSTSVEIINYHKCGIPYWIELKILPIFDPEGQLTHFLSMQSDITERKETEEALRHSQEDLATAQRLAHLGSWELEIETQSISWSDEVTRLLGLDPTETHPTVTQYLQRIHPEERKALMSAVQEAARIGASNEFDQRLVLPDGSLKIVQTFLEPRVNAQGQIVKVVGAMLDITERRQLEQQNQEQLRSLDFLRVTLETQQEELRAAQARLDSPPEIRLRAASSYE